MTLVNTYNGTPQLAIFYRQCLALSIPFIINGNIRNKIRISYFDINLYMDSNCETVQIL